MSKIRNLSASGITINLIPESKDWTALKWDIGSHSLKVAGILLHYIDFFDYKETCEFSINLCNDKKIQVLNANFLGKDKPTNVLSFPSFELKNGNFKKLKKIPDNYLGDIAISYERVLEEAAISSKNFKNHYTHMVVHAILHLLGFDHQTSKDAEKMESLEIKILSLFDIKNPYLE